MHLIPASATPDARRILLGRSLRAFADGYVAILLPLYLSTLGMGPAAVGAIATSTLLGSALLTLALGLVAHRLRRRAALCAAGLLMAATGAAFAGLHAFWPLLTVAFVGTLNPSSGDVSVFLPLEHTVLAQGVAPQERTILFSRYSFIGSVVGALGALSAALVQVAPAWLGALGAMQALFALYGLLGLATTLLYRGLEDSRSQAGDEPRSALGPSRRRVYGLAALFSVDAFGGGFIVNSLLALWLFQRFGLSVATASAIFLATGLCSAVSFLVAPRLAARFGLVNTMVYTHLPSNLLLVAAALAPGLGTAAGLLVARSFLTQMDVPTRTSYVMAVVTPEERAAAASLTAVPRSLAAAGSPAIAGWLLALSSFGWPLVISGVLKIGYDLALLRLFAHVKPPEEQRAGP